jgi:hypothetical protein
MFLTGVEETSPGVRLTFLIWNSSSASVKVPLAGLEVRQGDALLARAPQNELFLSLALGRDLRPDERSNLKVEFASFDPSGPPLTVTWNGITRSAGRETETLAGFGWELPL